MNISTKTFRPASDSCAACDARCQGFCDLLDGSCAAVLAGRRQQIQYKRGDELLLQGEGADKIGIISSGLIKVVQLTEEGDHQVLQILKPGQIVGDLCNTENTFSWEAAIPARICWINRSALDAMMRDHPQIYRAYLNVIAHQLDEHRLWVASMRGRNTLQRIAFWLLQQVPTARDGAHVTIHIVVTRRDLASLLDMTVETLCRGLYQLADRNAVELLNPELIEVVNVVKLRLLARCEDARVSETLNSRDAAISRENPYCISQPTRDDMWSQLPPPR